MLNAELEQANVTDTPPVVLHVMDAAERSRLSGPGLRTFLAISHLWRLTEAETLRILGSPSRSTYHRWARAAREHRAFSLSVDTLERISGVLGVYQALRVLHPTEQDGLAWLRGEHHAVVFGGGTPLELLTSGTQDAILTVRRFLDASQGGLTMAPNELDARFCSYQDEDVVIS